MGEDQDDLYWDVLAPCMDGRVLAHLDKKLGVPQAVGDVTFEDEPPEFPAERFDLKCGDCGAPMALRKGKKGYSSPNFYGCSTYPKCDGKLGAKGDGAPRGIPGSKADRLARIKAHKVFDRIWKEKLAKRADAYRWLRFTMGLSSTASIGDLDEKQCEALIRHCYEHHPTLQTRYSRLAYSEE